MNAIAAKLRGVVAVVALLVAATPAHADAVGYRGVVDVRAESDELLAEHHHDWSRATEDARFKMISTTRDPFTADNDYAWLQVRERAGGALLFRAPVPALTALWISPDSRYVVGLSTIKLWNPYQLVVFERGGRRLLARSMLDVDWPGVMQSVTNVIRWYKEPTPAIRIDDHGGAATLVIEDPRGVEREFVLDEGG